MAAITPKYIDATNLKALAFLAFVGAMAYVVVGGIPVVFGGLAVAAALTIYRSPYHPRSTGPAQHPPGARLSR